MLGLSKLSAAIAAHRLPGVEGKNGQVQTSPELLMNAADRALNQARTAGAAQVAAAWGNV